MYGCYFGPQAANGGCAGANGECHATSAGEGVPKSGFVCGATQDSCWQGVMNAALTLVTPDTKAATGLEAYVYKAGSTPGPASNNMPLSSFGGPPVMNASWKGFTPADLGCISDWAAAGAPNN